VKNAAIGLLKLDDASLNRLIAAGSLVSRRTPLKERRRLKSGGAVDESPMLDH
jgi:hypothetical protein